MIFKTIDSSVDETRKTLALFNKDWNTYKRNWQNANGVFGKIGSVFTPANAISKSDIEAIKAYNSQIDSCVTSQTAFNRTMLNASPAAQNLVASYNGGKVSAQGMATAQNAAKASTIGLTIAQTALNAAIGMGIGLLISLAVKGIDKLVHANEEAIEKAEELRRKYEEFKSTNESNISTLNGLKKEFEELSKGVSQYGDNVSLTTEQYERYKEIIQQIVGMSPSLAEGYSTENGYIADKNGLLERAIELQEQEYRNELRKITNLQNLKTSMSGYIAEYKDAFEGGWATEDMSATSTVKATDFSNALYKAFNYSERYNNGYSSEDLAREILKSLGIDNIDKEMEKFFNENGYYQPNWFFDEYVDEIAKNIDAITNALSYENVGLEEDEFENRILTVKDCAQAYLDMKDSISMANESIQRDLQYIAEYADGYSNLTTEQQKFVNEFLKGFNIDDIVSRDWFGNLTYDEDKMKSVKRQITDFVEALSQDETTKTALADLYAIPTDEQSISEFIDQFRNALEVIKAYCQENGIEIPIAITDSEQTINDLEAQYQRAVDFTKDKFDGYDPTAFFKEHSINTQEEIDAWQEIAQGARDAAEAEREYIQGSTLNKNPISLSLTETIDQLNTQLKPTFDSLKSAYEDIFTTDDNGNPLFTLENVYLSMLDSIKSAIDELNENEELGISIDYSSFENLARTLADTASTESDVRNGFNEFITDVVYGTAALENLNASDAKLIETMLESLGVTNAHEIVYDSLIAKTEALALQEQLLASVGGDLTNATADKVLAFLNQAGASEVARNYLIKLIAEEQVFSNQDLDVSGKISKLQELAQAYGQTALAAKIASQEKANEQSHTVGSWSEADLQQFQKEWNDGLSSVSIDFSPKSSSKSKKSGSSKSEKDLWLEEYKKKLAELQNLLDKGIINEREFFSQSEILLNTYLKDSEEHMTKYAEEISDAEKTLHSDRVNAYQYESDELSRLRDGNYLNMAEYYQSMMGLQDEYYNSEALKLKNLADTMEAQYGRMSHITLTRPSVDASEIQNAGYTTDLTSSSVYAQSYGDETKQVVLTPVLPDGTILSPEALQSYAVKLLNGEKIDADIQLSMFEGKDAVKQTVEYINGLEKMQAEYQTLKKTFAESPYGDFTEEQLEALEKLTEEIEKHKSQLSSELGDIKSAYDGLIEIRDTYNEYGKISVDQYQSLCDMGFEYLALLSNESGALSLDEDAFQRLTDAKIQQIQVDMALQATDLIKNIQTEEQAVQYLAASYENLAANALSAAEQMLYAAQANAQLMYGADSMQAQAANTIVKGYENSKLMAGVVDIKMQSGGGYPEEKKKKEEKPEERNWAEKILDNIEKHLEKSNKFIEKISDQTGRLIDKVDRFFAWQKKNSMINRAVKSTDKEIAATEKQVSQLITAVKKVKNVSDLYAKKMDKIGESLSEEYKNKIKNGALEIEDIEDTDLQETIKNYEKWYEKIEDCKDKMDEYNDSVQECRDSISKLYEQQRDLIRQKLDNILSYYSDMDSYLSSITSKIESIISLNDEMGKRSSITELVEEFAAISGQLSSAVKTEITGSVNVTENPFGDSKKVAAAVERDRQELIDSLQHDIDNLSPDQSGTYAKLLKNIAKTESQVDKYIDKGWDVTKSKQFDKLTKKLENYYDMQNELDQNATSNTVANYQKIYAAQQKLQNKIDSGKDLSKSEQKKYDSYEKQLEKLQKSGQDSLDKLYEQLAIADGTAQKQTEADKIKKEISDVHDSLENSATYKNLLSSIEKVENKLAKLDEKGYENLSKSQKKTYDKLQAQLEAYYAQKESLDESATSANVVQYNKIYLAWKKLQDKLDKGKNLSVSEWKKYDQYTKQLENYSKEKADTLSKMNDDLADALNPGDKLEQIEKTYEESAEGLYDSYHKQIDGINDEVKNTQQYQNLLAKAQKLEQKKDTKGLSKSEQAKLDKYNAELEALQKGGTGTNIGDYMKTWESWYKLQQKLDNGKKLSASEAKKYDSYKAKLEAWNNEKQTQVGDLLSQMEDDLEQLKQKFEQNMSDAEADVNEYFSNLYKLAKQIAEYNLSTLKSQLEYLDSCISYYKELVSLYDTFDSDKLTGLLTDLDETHVKDQTQAYEEYLNSLKEKYNTTLSEMNEYQELLGALDTNDFGSSMNVFKKAMEGYKQSGNTAMAEKLQSVLDLLNERAADAGNWGEYADQWASEWENAFTSAKQELIDTAKEIQNVNDGLRQIRLDRITDEIKKLDDAKSVLASIEGLIQDDWIFEKDGELSEYGRAKAALLVSQLEDSQKKANEYLNLYNEIQHSKDSYASEKAYREELNNAAQNYYDTMNETASLENSIVELMKRSAEEEINSLKKIIEARKQALQKKKEYYDYDKSLKNSQKEIDSIKAQIAAIENLSGAMDAATKAKLAQLKADLAEKEDSLKETKDDHTYNLQIDALDEFAASLTDTLENSTKSIAEILKEYEDAVNSAKDIYKTSTDSVNDTMSKLISFYSGMGMSVDGTEIMPNQSRQIPSGVTAVPVQKSSRKTDSTIVVNDAESMNEFSKFLRDKLNGTLDVSDKRAFDITSILRDATERGVPVTLKDFGIMNVADTGLVNAVNENLPQMKYAVVNTIPESIKNVQPVINVHYDNMINVEGSVDKSFSKEFTQNSDKLYKDFTNKLAKDLQHNGVNFVRRQTLPTVR